MLGAVAGLVSREGVEIEGAETRRYKLPRLLRAPGVGDEAMTAMIVAIDGPAGAGKSTVARALAERLGFRYLDTGAMYRALTWLAMKRGLRPRRRGARSAQLAREQPVTLRRGRPRLDRRHRRHRRRSAKPQIDRMVPVVARHPAVREVMRERQRELGRDGDVVIEGRDIGTVVAPDAEVKVYLVADRDGAREAPASPSGPGIGADALATDLRMRDESDAARMQPAPTRSRSTRRASRSRTSSTGSRRSSASAPPPA